MGYLLSWKDNNLSEDGHRIYRSSTPIDPDNLPEPLAVVGADLTQFEDVTAEEGVLYYYRVSAFKGASEAVSVEIRADGDDPGPGPGDLPENIGDEFGGGFYIGDITIADGPDAGTYAIIMAGMEGQVSARWNTTNTATAGTGSHTDGLANTLAMQARDLDIHTAGKHCLEYRGGGFSDWYLPAVDELLLAWVNRAALAGLAMEAQIYWSSTQITADTARVQDFNDGVSRNNIKSSNRRVRPVRRLKI